MSLIIAITFATLLFSLSSSKSTSTTTRTLRKLPHMALVVSSSIAISTHTFQSSERKLSQIGSVRVLKIPYGVGVKSSQPRTFVKPINVRDSDVPPTATVAASEAIETELEDFERLVYQLENASSLEIIDRALEEFGNDIAIAFSGAEDVALIEYAYLTGRPFRVFSLDTRRLNPETYRLFDAVEKKYGICIEYMFPDVVEVQDLVRSKGLFLFYEDGHQECCRVRKVRPLRRALKGLRAWITRQRKHQSPGTRSEIPVVQVDPIFEGIDSGTGSLIN